MSGPALLFQVGQQAHSVSVTGDIGRWSPGGFHSGGEGAQFPHPKDRSSQCQGGEWKWGEKIGDGANCNVVRRRFFIIQSVKLQRDCEYGRGNETL